MDEEILRFILSGVTKDLQPPLRTISRPPGSKLISPGIWENITKLEQLGNTIVIVGNLRKTIIDNLDQWEEYIRSPLKEVPLPEPFTSADPMLQLALSKILRPEDMLVYVKKLIQLTLGDYFLNDPIQGIKEAA